ncbi:MAG: hypothetical protein RI924_952 [Bacteroidota bacterium]|jgi:phage shock protein PspC (stress-responsive transcriptional regulator)
MNKTIIININGIVFHIEENAYEVLIKYMNEVKQHFGNSTDSYEIVSDIENRLAEMFSEKLTEAAKEVIVLADVEQVIGQMGKPSDFDYDTESSENGFSEQKTRRKLFRDTEDRIIGGVCSGIGQYFDIEARWIRVITLLFILFGGSGLFIYVILWIIMPKAVSRADKMAMKGEAPNLQNFKKNFEEEIEGVKSNLGRSRGEFQTFFQKLGSFIEQLFQYIGQFLRGMGKILLKVIGVFIVGIGLIVLFSMLVALLAVLGVWNGEELPGFPFNVVNPEDRYILYICAFLVIIIPLVSLILFALRILFNRPSLNKNISFGLLIGWLVALSTGLYYGFKTGGEFKQEARFSQTQTLPVKPVYVLELNEEKYITSEDSLNLGIKNQAQKGRILINGDHADEPDNFKLNIEKSEVEGPRLLIDYGARGRNFQKALDLAKKIEYRYVIKDSSILFDQTAYIKPRELWRDQHVKVTLQVPVNTKLIINTKLDRYLNNYNLWDCQSEGETEYKLSEWIMTEDGLKCANDSIFKENNSKKRLR